MRPIPNGSGSELELQEPAQSGATFSLLTQSLGRSGVWTSTKSCDLMTSCPKRITDDGNVVTLDLHGCTVDDGLHVVRRSLQEAYRRGRTKLDVIHGTSTSERSRHERTIKNELLHRLDGGRFSEWASGYTTDASGGRTTFWINLGANSNPNRLRANDVAPP